MKRASAIALLVAVGVMLDTVGGPVVLAGHVQLHFTAAAVAVVGLRRGAAWGVASGWCAGAVLAALSCEPVGLSMLSLGVTGMLGGALHQAAALGLVWLDTLMLLGLIVVDEVVAGLAAWVTVGTPLRPDLIGLAATAFVACAALAARGSRTGAEAVSP